MGNEFGLVFLHGAGLNKSIWDELNPLIDHPILCIDFPNRNSDGKSNAKLTIDEYINSVKSEIRKWNQGNFILVAHSIAGMIGLQVASDFKNELKGFVAIGSVIPKSGQSFVSSLPFPQKILLPILLSIFGTMPPKKSIEMELCHDLTAENSKKIVKEFTAEAKSIYTTKLKFDLPETMRLYVRLANDKSISPILQFEMANNLMATKIEEINSGHLPMLSKPNDLAKILNDFVKTL